LVIDDVRALKECSENRKFVAGAMLQDKLIFFTKFLARTQIKSVFSSALELNKYLKPRENWPAKA